ncbi:hypothetical protein OIDMADRAFT_145702 [Oidiodendron maius Zn]|uniref:Heterokaryon incompatibility domain-containing protein n=1 Tax=Oidiodendron maius (strain Zn) TaxID=913774 RepID=A0A0C3GVU0_OIDMZ|nr:hypothetical protein OIDMADRAFT_145702 [Oidiodendron maius Zn]
MERLYRPKESFAYKPLKATRDGPSIRLLRLQPGSRQAPVVCDLTDVALVEELVYDAISYTWGIPGRDITQVQVVCNNGTLMIGENLEAALRHLRRDKEVVVIWADAICINQKDNEEKSQQVRLMRQIYQKATVVHIWLGAAGYFGHHTLAGMATLALLAWGRGQGDFPVRYGKRAPLFVTKHKDRIFSFIYSWCQARGPTPNVLQVLDNYWFSRIWIIQELAVSSNVVVHKGDVRISWPNFLYGVSLFSEASELQRIYGPRRLQFLTSLQSCRASFTEGGRKQLFDLALEHRNCGASDPRDKIFALCGLASDDGPEGLDVNIGYSTTAQEVYKAFATAILKTSYCMDLLSVPRLPVGQRLPGLPSWVPDWSAASASISLRHRFAQYGYLFEPNASKDTEATFALSNDGARLQLEGFVVDEIIEVASLLSATSSSVATMSKAWSVIDSVCRRDKILLEWENLAIHEPEGLYPTGEKLFEAYVQVLLASSPFQQVYKDDYIKFHSLSHIYAWLLKRYEVDPKDSFAKLRKGYIGAMVYLTSSLNKRLVDKREVSKFIGRMEHLIEGRRLVKTKAGYLGLGPEEARPGDVIALVKGAKVPLVLRSSSSSLCWELVGDAYVHGMMQGELFNADLCKALRIE